VRHPLRTTAKGRLDRRLGPSLSRRAIAVAIIRARSSCRKRRIRRTANHQRGKELRGARLRFFGKKWNAGSISAGWRPPVRKQAIILNALTDRLTRKGS
jgi:hypothetical protein